MASPRLIRWGGFAAVLGGALTAALVLLPAHPIDGLNSSSPGEYLRVFLTGLAALLLAGGLVGLHARQSGGYGRLGAAGFLLAFVAAVAGAVLWPVVWFATDASAGGAPPSAGMAALGLAGGVEFVGLAVLAAAPMRAGVLPLLWRALPLAIVLLGVLSSVATPGYLALGGRNPESLVLEAPQLLACLCWALLGYALLSGRSEGVGRPASVR